MHKKLNSSYKIKKIVGFFVFSVAFLLAFISPSSLSSQNIKPQLVITNPDYNPGFFSVFNTVLSALYMYDGNPDLYNGLEVHLRSGLYLDNQAGPNWWEYYFEPLCIRKNPLITHHIFNTNELIALGWWPITHLNRQKGFELINKYIKIKEPIQRKVNAFVETHFSNQYVIGIHYRGTDKTIAEARRISYEEVAQTLSTAIQNIGHQQNGYCLFIATDEQNFLEYIQNRFTCPIFYIQASRSMNGQPVHFTGYANNNYQKGEDALVDCLLLSKCHFLIRTVSNLSFIAERFNPTVPVFVLK